MAFCRVTVMLHAVRRSLALEDRKFSDYLARLSIRVWWCMMEGLRVWSIGKSFLRSGIQIAAVQGSQRPSSIKRITECVGATLPLCSPVDHVHTYVLSKRTTRSCVFFESRVVVVKPRRSLLCTGWVDCCKVAQPKEFHATRAFPTDIYRHSGCIPRTS